MSSLTTAFALPEHLAAKADPARIGADERHFTAVAGSLERSIAELTERLDAERRAGTRGGEEALNRDLEVHRLTARLRALRRFGLDLCLGRMVGQDGSTVYVGRLGLTDADGRRLLVDWRSPAAAPFFGATHGTPMGLASRRRYRWTLGKVTDYWDEVFTAGGLEGAAADADSAFLASLGGARSERMRDVLATIAADQDAIVRAGSSGALVVDGGPGTGKTVVALHRAAYLLYADPRIGRRTGHSGGVLFVGPHEPYLAYVADVLPSLGEEGVQTCTLRDLVPQGAAAGEETDPRVAAVKADRRWADAVEDAVRFYEEPPRRTTVVATPWAEVRLTAAEWAEAFAAPDPGTPHNEGRDVVWQELLTILTGKLAGADPDPVRRSLDRNGTLLAAFNGAWPLLEAADVVADLWSVPAYLRRCAPWLDPGDARALRRSDPYAWTTADLPLLDLARQRLGDPEASRRRRRAAAELAARRDRMTDVVDELVATDDSDLLLMTSLRQQDLRDALVDDSGLAGPEPDLLAGPFAHVIVDEAQELTDAQWQMLRQRCPSGSFTVVGDRAQARHGFAGSWRERLERAGLDRVQVASLTINYRTPEEVMAEAAPVIRAALPDANVPTSIRSSGLPVVHAAASERDAILAAWRAGHAEGVACVIGDPAYPGTDRVRSLTPELAKGLEFDLVVLVDPDRFGGGVQGAVDRYVAMTRATQQLVVLTNGRPG